MDRYVGGEEIDEDVLVDDLERAVARATFFPVVPVCSVTGVGCAELLDLATRGFPSPSEHPAPDGVHARRARPRRPISVRPRRAAGRRDRQDHQRPVRRPAQPGPRLLRDAAARPAGARVGPLHVVLRRRARATRTTTRTSGSARWRTPFGRAQAPAVADGRRRPVRDRPADPGRDRRHALLGRRPAGAAAVVDARAAAAGRDRRAQQGRRGQALAGAGPARRRGPVAADREQRRDPPAGAVVHG